MYWKEAKNTFEIWKNKSAVSMFLYSPTISGQVPVTAAVQYWLKVSQIVALVNARGAKQCKKTNAAAECRGCTKRTCRIQTARPAYLGLPCHFGATGSWQPVCCLLSCRSVWSLHPRWRAWWFLWFLAVLELLYFQIRFNPRHFPRVQQWVERLTREMCKCKCQLGSRPNGSNHTISPRTVRKALVVLTGIVKSEQVYWPSSDRVTSLIRMVSSCDDARTSSILWSLRAGFNTMDNTTITKDEWLYSELVWKQGIPGCMVAERRIKSQR